KISHYLNMSPCVVQRVLQLHKELGDVMQDPQILLILYMQYILKLLEEKPDTYLDEITLELNDAVGVDVSIATVHRSLKLLGITSKKLSKVAFERCHAYHLDFLFKIASESADCLVFTDESAINTLTSYRSMG
ncbi:hypothetical protein K439DRAFT_1297002, partial [Ramaria rubella]